MDIIFGEEFVEAVFVIGTVVVLSIVWFAYYRNKFSPWFSMLSTLVFVTYMVAFLYHSHVTGSMEEHAATIPFFAFLGAVHGIISLLAIVVTLVAFYRAEPTFRRGGNFFTAHPQLSLFIALLWPAALISGMLL